jgi:hypothetical protein
MNSIQIKFADDKAYGRLGGHAAGNLVITVTKPVSKPKVFIKLMSHKFVIPCASLKAGENTIPFRISVPSFSGCCMRIVGASQYKMTAAVGTRIVRLASTIVYFTVEGHPFHFLPNHSHLASF